MKILPKPITSWVFGFLPLRQAQIILSVHSQLLPSFNSTFSNPMGKIVQNVNYLSISQNSNLSWKLNHTHQHEFRSMLGFKNRVSNLKLLKFHANRDNSAYLEKYDVQRKLVCQFWDCHWIYGVETSLGVVSDPNSMSQLAMQ